MMASRIWSWLNERWPFSYLLRLGLEEEIPGGSRFPYTLGSAVLTVFLLQVVTGILQLFYYVPTVDHAYDSVNFLRTRVPFGWLVNGLHYWGANAMVVLIGLHVARVFVWGAYKHPRQLTWLFGIGLLLLAMGSSFTGAPLPWDQRGYWAAEVGTSIPGSVPVVGETIKRIMRGGEEMGQLTLSRLFTLHAAVLPAALLGLIALHLIAFRWFGSVGPWAASERARKGFFWPDQVFKDAVVGACVILALVGLSVFLPKPFSGAADPLDSSYLPKPEWNFLFLYEALKYFPGRLEPVGALGVPGFLVTLLVILPFIDRTPERNPLKRPIAMTGGFLLVAAIGVLTVAGYLSKPFGSEAIVPPASTALPAAASGVTTAGAQTGAQLFRSLGCIGCHRVDGGGGAIGPDLSQEGLKGRAAEWLTVQIRNPKMHFPGTIMPSYSSPGDAEIKMLVDYLLSLRAQGVPPTTAAAPAGETVLPALKGQASLSPSAPGRDLTSPGATAPAEPGRAAFIIGSAERGRVLFESHCASCHGTQGRGGVPNPGSAAESVPRLRPIRQALSNADPRLFAENIDRIIQHGSVPAGPNPRLRMPAFGETNALTQQQIANAEAYVLQMNGVDRGEPLNAGIPPKPFFIVVLSLFTVAALALAGRWSRIERQIRGGGT
jgi:ubiquinol-cytochrome c reductase cytochrome b subunit